MSEQELYEIAQQRIDHRNRRLLFFGIDLAGFLAYIGIFILLAQTAFSGIGVAILLVWCGVFVLHCIMFSMSESRDKDIEGEVANLRQVDYSSEKPKRLALGDDGELVELRVNEDESPKMKYVE
jgi:hypothetical protein